MKRDEILMAECLDLAARGRGAVSPNPMVGAVIIRRGKIIGRGYHRKFGGPHAEVNAIRSCRGPVRGATLYVNLEPCCHHGKTPPCTELIIRSGISRVVVGMKDPNPLVSGRGLRALRGAGLSVTSGVLSKECEKLNEAFSKHLSTGQPLVTIKIAQSADGVVADYRGSARWITGEAARRDGHRRRGESDAILVGAGTITQDDPLLTVRHIRGRQPLRVVLDGKLSVETGARIFKDRRHPVVLVTTERAFVRHRKKASVLGRRGVTFIIFPGDRKGSIPVRNVLIALGRRGVSSLIVEGGPATWGAFLNAGSADRLLLYTAPTLLGGNRKAFSYLRGRELHAAVKLKNILLTILGEDVLLSADVKFSPRIG